MHCRKVAGSSITAILNRYLGPDDIQIGIWGDTLKAGGKLNRKAKATVLSNPAALVCFLGGLVKNCALRKDSVVGRAMNPAIRLHYQSSFSNNPAHAMASEVREFDPQAWDHYYKFCFVRNPFDYAVSEYFWLRCPVRGVSFKEFLLRKLDETRPDPEGISVYPSTNWEIYTINDEIAVDRVGKFENIYQDIEEISGEIGLKIDSHLLPHLKSETRKKTFRQVYDDDTRLLAEKIYSKELTAFAYSF